MWSLRSLPATEDFGMYTILSNKKTGHTRPHTIVVLFVLLLPAVICSSCGYSNPYSRDKSLEAPVKTLQITTWQNRTNELGLESLYFRLFNAWFKQSSRIAVVFEEDQADLKLSGEISAIDLPGLFYDSFDEALEIKIKLTVRFTLSDNRNNSVLWQERRFIIYEPFILDPSGERTRYNKQRALLHIGDELGELIYLRTHEIVHNLP